VSAQAEGNRNVRDDDPRLAAAEAVVGHVFADRRLLEAALTHPSWAAEHPGTPSYDRLEFLGDAVLGFIVSDDLFRALPDAPEGDLTLRKHHVVSGASLASVAAEFGVGDLLLLGRGAHAAGERQRASVLENLVEALIGAIYLDAGLPAATTFVLRILAGRITGPLDPPLDPKSALQHLTQGDSGMLPEYRITTTEGPPHDRVFRAEVTLDGGLLGTGEGQSKQAAEKAAASAALEELGRSRD